MSMFRQLNRLRVYVRQADSPVLTDVCDRSCCWCICCRCSVDGSSSLRYRIRKKTRRSSSPCLSDSSLHEQYRHVQKGGEIPVAGLGCLTPPRKGLLGVSSSSFIAKIKSNQSSANARSHTLVPHRGTLFLQTYVQFPTAVVLNQNWKPIFFN